MPLEPQFVGQVIARAETYPAGITRNAWGYSPEFFGPLGPVSPADLPVEVCREYG